MNIYFELQQHLINNAQLIVIPNYYYKGFECDVLTVSKKLYTTEYEIKTSKEDFQKDFQKSRRYYDWQKREIILNITKHNEIKEGNRTNKFVFVILKGLDVEIPDYAGIMQFEIMKHLTEFKLIKHPKWLHKNKIHPNTIKHIAQNLSWRYYKLQYYNEYGITTK